MEPALSCLEIRAVAGSCECHTLLEVLNTCTSSVNAMGFTFLHGASDPSTGETSVVRDTSTIAPEHSCMREELLTGNGTTDHEYDFTPQEYLQRAHPPQAPRESPNRSSHSGTQQRPMNAAGQ